MKTRLRRTLLGLASGGALALILGVMLPVASTGAGDGEMRMRVPVIVELFTSEGCSSCPPAEKVLATLAEEQPIQGADIVPLAFHVDYWDGLGWPDPFASAEFTARQYAYAKHFRSGQVYTPQMIVAGTAEFSGFKERTARGEIEKAAGAPRTDVGLHLLPAREGDDPALRRFRIDVAPLDRAAVQGGADVALALTEDGLASKVLRGENAGRTLEHRGVVRRLIRAGKIAGSAEHTSFETEVTLDPGWKAENLRAVAFVQTHDGQRIVGAATVAPGVPGAPAPRR